MSEEFNNKPSFKERLKSMKINRSAVIAGCLLTASVVVVCAVAVATNRAKKEDISGGGSKAPITQNDGVKTPETENNVTPPETEKPTSKPNQTPSVSVDDKLPAFILPVSGALTGKHDPEIQVYSNTLGDYRVHLGIDIATNEGASVYSAADGTVARVWKDDMMGYSIAIKHTGDCYTFYQNLSDTLPEGLAEGATVRAGQLIGTIGDSALVEIADEPHLHFEMTVADLSVDPLEYFSEDALHSLTIDASYE